MLHVTDFRIHDVDSAHYMAHLYDEAFNFYRKQKKLVTRSLKDRKYESSVAAHPILEYIIEPLNEKLSNQARLFTEEYTSTYRQWLKQLELDIEGEYTVLPDFLYNYGKLLVENDDARGIYFLVQYLEHTSEYEQYREKVLQNFMYDDQQLEAYIMPSGEIYDWQAMLEYKDFIVEQLMDIHECVLQGSGVAVALPDFKLPVSLALEQFEYPLLDEKEALDRYQYIDYSYLYECFQANEIAMRMFEIMIPAWAYNSYITFFESEMQNLDVQYYAVNRSSHWKLEAMQYEANLAAHIQMPDFQYYLGTVAYIKLYAEDVNPFLERVSAFVKKHIYDEGIRHEEDGHMNEQIRDEYEAVMEGKQFSKWHESIQQYIRAAMLSYARHKQQRELVEDSTFHLIHRKLYDEYVNPHLAKCYPLFFSDRK